MVVETGGLFVKGVADTNAAALDKALEALQVYLSKANEGHAARFVGDVLLCKAPESLNLCECTKDILP